MRKMSRRELVQMAAVLTTTSVVQLRGARGRRCCSGQPRRLCRVRSPGSRRALTIADSILSVYTYEPIRRRRAGCASRPERGRGRSVAAETSSQGDRAHRWIPRGARAAASRHARDAHVPGLPAREDRLRQPSRRQRARLRPDSDQAAAPAAVDDLRARPRPRRGRHRRHRRKGPGSPRSGRLSVRFRHSGGGTRNGGRGDRADGVRLPPRRQNKTRDSAQRPASRPPAARCCSARR